MHIETFTCHSCGGGFDRQLARGRKPTQCYSCKPRAEVTSRIQTVYTDAGRSAGENNDCTVRAIATAFLRPYAAVHEVLAGMGRQEGRGTKMHYNFLDREIAAGRAVKVQTATLIPGRKPVRMTLGRFIQKNPTGRFVVNIQGHALAVINGVVHDMGANAPYSRVLLVWRVIQVGP